MTQRPVASDLAARLTAIVRSEPMLMSALRAARAVDPPDWLIGAGAIRDLVWDRLHGYDVPTAPKDVDLVYFDPTSTDRELASIISESRKSPWI